MRLSSANKMRDADNIAIQVMGVPSDYLMKNAAGHVAEAAMELMANPEVYIFCGSGNNGGDGVAAALYLMRWGAKPRVLLVGEREKMTRDTAEMERRLIQSGGRLEDFNPDEPGLTDKLKKCGAIIDAMYGIGLRRNLQGKALRAAALINEAGVPVVAADIPSGVEADTGRILGAAVRATKTITFSMAKPGHFVEPGCTVCGTVEVVDIGLPKELLEKAGTETWALTEKDLHLPRRNPVSHKSDYGRVLILGGSVGYTGAPNLCAGAAVRGGAGLVYLGVPERIYDICAVKQTEAMPFPLPCDGAGRFSASARTRALEMMHSCDVTVLGPGLGRSDDLTALVHSLVCSSEKPLVLDADGLYALGQNMETLKNARCPVVLTPHEGEFKRLGGVLTGDRVADARRFAVEYSCVLVLKGHRCICAFPDGTVYITNCGNPGMAKGGSGDVLAGLVGAFLGQLPLKRAVLTAVWLHGRAGDIACAAGTAYTMTPSDIIDCLHEAVREILD